MQDVKEKENDFYQILGLSQDATDDQIYEQYLKLSLKYHPDKGGDESKYKLVNLAYQVLKDPQNRQKYNSALATTFNQFKEEDRDTSYHVNPEFLTNDVEQSGKTVFDLEKFLAEFEAKRSLHKETAEINPNQVKVSKERPEELLARLSAARDQDLVGFQSTQKTNLFDPANNAEEFNYVFNQYKSLHTRELEAVEDEDLVDVEKGEAPVNFFYTSGQETQAKIQALTDNFKTQFSGSEVPTVTSENKANVNQLEQYVALHRQQQAELEDPTKVQFKNTLDDSQKPLLPE